MFFFSSFWYFVFKQPHFANHQPRRFLRVFAAKVLEKVKTEPRGDPRESYQRECSLGSLGLMVMEVEEVEETTRRDHRTLFCPGGKNGKLNG